MEVFIVRPFGIKKVLLKNAAGPSDTIDINFDEVQNKLITPALDHLLLKGGTTGKIFAPGDIREDMFSLLLLADIVIADITIHNANVFYELGIRHALRDKMTILIKCPDFDTTPFDILGYRYLDYNRADPAAALPRLIDTLQETIQSGRTDSPVFKMLPKLESQDPDRFMAVPTDFSEEVEIAFRSGQVNRLSLMASEVQEFVWQIPAWRLIGEALFKLGSLAAARIVWENIKSGHPGDRKVNDRLANIYQRLAEKESGQNPVEAASLLTKSDLAIDNLLGNYEGLNKQERAEAYSLKARNTKTKWINAWKNADPAQRGPAALRSGYLQVAYDHYEQGFYENLNHSYAGINAFSLLTVMITLADTYPDEWSVKFKKQKDADQELEDWKEKKQTLAVSVQTSIDAEKRRLEKTGKTDVWVSITEADFTLLTETNPARIASLYRAALQEGEPYQIDSVLRQMNIYDQLGILPDQVKASLNAIPGALSPRVQPAHYLLFTGHMIDQPGRPDTRYPPEKEAAVYQKIREAVKAEIEKTERPYRGVAGGACGGDIQFHEVCKELGVPTELLLALPREAFVVESVEFAGPQWIERFNNLYDTLPHQELLPTKELPKWLQKKEDYSLWQRNNLWELNSALVNGGTHMTLFALWDGKGGDGAGGTEHMVKEARSRGAKTIVLNINQIA